MTAIFISHSSADNCAASDMKAWLEQQGHTSLFLDFDPEAGIRAGGNWEETLYYKLRQCQAVVALLTPSWLASKWCFAELVQAREKGKAIFPVRVLPCDTSVFSDVQHIDLTEKPDEGYQRLAIGLRERGLDPLDVFDWDPKRPPYPGLLAFQEDDAAIFFGRGQEILNGLETLDALRRRGRGAPRFVLFLGASGSGKSSLVRAGIIPRLKKAPSEWLPLAPFRPQDDPLDELAIALADRFEALGRPQDWGEIGQKLKAAAGQETADGKVLLSLVRELAILAKQREATVVLTIDQAEELFGYSSADAASLFWRLLRAALEASDRQLIAVATMRSDFLGEFQGVRALRDPAYNHDFAYQAVPVDPMPERNFVEIIRGPARLAGLRLEDGLVEAMVGDTVTRDALPLLAFTLRRIYDRYGEDGLLEIREYYELGRLEGAIRAEAERVLGEAQPSPEDLDALRAAFVPTMVRINAEGGYAKRRARADEMPPRAKTLLRRFIDARLLISDRDQHGVETVEVAHEALLRTWPQLSGWLDDDQDKLRLLESILRAAEEWNGGERSADLLVHRDGRLKDAEALITNRRFAVRENSLEKGYLDSCIEAQQAREAAEREEQERRVRDAERIAEEQKKAAAAQKKTAQRTAVGLAVAVVFAALAGWQWYEATNQQTIAEQRATEAAEQRTLANQRAAEAEAEAKRAKAEERKALAQESRALAAFARSEIRADNAVNGMLLALRGMPIEEVEEPRPVVTETRQALVDGTQAQRELQVLRGHEGAVYAASWSRDGARIVSGSADNTVRVRNAKSGNELLVLRGHEGAVNAAAFSPDGARIVSGSEDKTVRVWDAASGDELLILRGHDGTVNAAAFSPDGTRIMSGSDDTTVRVWDAGIGKELLVLQGHAESVTAASFSPDGARIVSGSDDMTFVVWDAASGEQLLVLSGPEASVVAAGFSPDGAHFVIGSIDGTVGVWDVASGGEPLVLRGHETPVWAAAFSPDGARIVSGSADQTIRVWDAWGGNELLVLRGHEGAVNAAAFSPDGTRIVSGSDDMTVRVWDAGSGKNLSTDVPVLAVGFSPDGARIVGSDNWRFGVWDAASGKELWVVDRYEGTPAFSPDGARIVSGSEDKTVRVWDAASGKELLVLRGHEGAVTAATFSPDGARIVSGSWDNTVRVWDAKSGNELLVLRGHEEFVLAASFSPDGARIVSGSWDNTVRVWDAASGKELLVLNRYEGKVTTPAFSPDGARIVSGSEDKTVRVWDAASGKELLVLRGHEGGVIAAGFSPDGARIVSGSDDNTVRVWDAKSGNELLVLRGDEGSVLAAGFSADGARIVSGSDDNTVRVWDAAGGDELLVLRGHKGPVYAAEFAPDGARIVSGSEDGTVRVWFVGKDDAGLVAHACERLPRDLSPQAVERFNLDPDAPWPCAERAKTLWPHPMAAALTPAAGPAKDGAAAAQ